MVIKELSYCKVSPMNLLLQTTHYTWVGRHESEYIRLRHGAKKATLHLCSTLLYTSQLSAKRTYTHRQPIWGLQVDKVVFRHALCLMWAEMKVE